MTKFEKGDTVKVEFVGEVTAVNSTLVFVDSVGYPVDQVTLVKHAPKVGDVVNDTATLFKLPQRTIVRHVHNVTGTQYKRRVYIRTGNDGWQQTGVQEYLSTDKIELPVVIVDLP